MESMNQRTEGKIVKKIKTLTTKNLKESMKRRIGGSARHLVSLHARLPVQ